MTQRLTVRADIGPAPGHGLGFFIQDDESTVEVSRFLDDVVIRDAGYSVDALADCVVWMFSLRDIAVDESTKGMIRGTIRARQAWLWGERAGCRDE